jgi:hypothetical protein
MVQAPRTPLKSGPKKVSPFIKRPRRILIYDRPSVLDPGRHYLPGQLTLHDGKNL